MAGGSFFTQASLEKGCLGTYSADPDNWQVPYPLEDPPRVLPTPPFALPASNEAAVAMCLGEGEGKGALENKIARPVHLFPNHNSSGDTLGFVFMMRLQCPISVIPHYITAQHWLKGDEITRRIELD
jgi:hypothetical protein